MLKLKLFKLFSYFKYFVLNRRFWKVKLLIIHFAHQNLCFVWLLSNNLCCFMGFDNLVTIFRSYIPTESVSKLFGYSVASTFWEIIFDRVIEFDRLEVVLGHLAVAVCMLLLLWVFTVFYSLWIFLPLLLRNNSNCSLDLVGSSNVLVNLVANNTKSIFKVCFSK